MQTKSLENNGNDGGRMRNPDKIRRLLITSFIVILTFGTPFISSILLINGLPGKVNPSITDNYDFTNNYSTSPQYELSKAPSLDDFFNEYDEGYLQPESYLPEEVSQLEQETSFYAYDENLVANIDLSKVAYQEGEIVDYSVQVTSKLDQKANYPIRILIITGSSFYYWYYNLRNESVIQDIYVQTNADGFYYGSFLPPEEGTYTIMVLRSISYDTYPIARRSVTISDLSVFWRVPYNAVRHASTQSYALVLNTSDFSPLVDANVTLTMEKYVSFNSDYNYSSELLYSGATNVEGLMLMDYSIETSGSGYSYLVLTVEYNESEAELTQFIWFNDYYYFSDNAYQNYNFITTTDKPIYQPGEMVRTRTMVFIDDYWEVNKEPAVSTEVEVEFKTVSGFTLFHKTLTTDEFGIIEWEFEFDIDTSLGTYTLTFRKDSSQESIDIEVDQYEKPDFRVNIELESDYVPPKKDIVGTIIAEYYFGKPVPGTVKITFFYYDIVLDEIEGALDSNGEFAFTWKVPKTNPIDGEEIEALYLNVEVIDPIGRIVYAEKDVTCLSNIWAYLWTWPWGVFNKGEEITASFSAYQVSVRNDYYWYSWGYVADADVTITVFGLGFLKSKIKLFSLESITNEYGSGFVTFTIPEEYCDDYDEFILDLEVRTSDGRTGEDSRAIALAVIHTVLELNPNTNIDPGDDIELTISVYNTEKGSLVDAEISVYIMDSEYDTLYYTWDYYLDGSETFTIKLSDYAPSGNYYINTYCRTENRLFGGYYPSYSSTYTQFVVGESNTLTIEADKETYLSSEEIVLTSHLGAANNVPTIFELTKRGIVDVITVDKSQTDFILTIEDINDLGPRLTIFAFTVTPNGLILEAFVVVEIIKDLNVEIESDKEIYEPGETATITISVTNENDEPVDAFGVFSLIDSSVFAIKEDPLSEEGYFEESRYWAQVSTRASWTSPMSYWWYWWMIDASGSYPYYPILEFSDDTYSSAFGEGRLDPQVEGEIRDNLPESANWLPRLEINDGVVVIEVQLPDNIGEWTIRVFVTADGQGIVEKETFKTFLPFFVDLKTPLGIVQDNVIVVRGIVYNYLSDVCTASLTLDASGLTILNDPTQTVVIPKDYLVEVRWSVYCDDFGPRNITLTGQTNVAGSNWFDGIRKSVNIQPNGVILETVTSGFVNNSKVIEYEIFDESVYENVDLIISPGIIDVAITSWERLIGYPYGCIEQTMSKIFPDVMIYHYLNQTGQLTSVIADQLDSMLQIGLSKIASYQHYDGGWGWWENDQSKTYMTAVVLYGLGLMKDLGLTLSDEHLLDGAYFLVDQQLPSGSFSTDGWRIDDLSFTAYVIRSLLANKFTDSIVDESLVDAIDYFKTSWTGGSSLKNPYAAALFIEATHGTSYEDASFLSALVDYILLEAIVEDEGLRWDITIDDHWRALGGTIETTATVITALTKMDFMLNFVTIRSGLSWLLTQQNSWGWGNTADTSAAIKAIVTVASYSSDAIDCAIDVTINGWTTQIVFNESESGFVSAEFLQLEEYLSVGNNSIIINQTGTGQIYYYFAAKQILRSDPEITITNPIYASPGEEFAVEVNLQHNSDVVYPVNIRIDSLEDDLIPVGDQNQTLQILLDSETVLFHYIAPDVAGEYYVGGFSVSYLFADSLLENFSPGIVMKTLTEVPVIVEESIVSLSKTNAVNSYNYQPFSEGFITQANDYNIFISREYSNVNDLARGETIEVTLEITNQWEDKEFVMIEESIPAGFTIDESSLQTGALVLDFSISAGKLTLFIGELEEGITEISYRMIVYDVGSSIAFPTQLSSMYDSWVVQSAPSVLGSLMVNVDPDTGAVTTDSLRPILVQKMAFLKDKETHFDVSISLKAFDNDEIHNVRVLFSGKNENWRTKDAVVTQAYNNGSKDFLVELGAFADEEVKYIIAVEDRSGNILFTEINTVIVPAVTAAFIFIFITIIISAAFAFATSSATRQLRPKRKPTKVVTDATKTTFKDTKEDLKAYKNLPEYKNGE